MVRRLFLAVVWIASISALASAPLQPVLPLSEAGGGEAASSFPADEVPDPYDVQASPVVKGKVFDASTGEPIVGATIYFTDEGRGTASDAEGFFELDVQRFPVRLRVSYIGYETQEMEVKSGKHDLFISLTDNARIDEVVVVAYGTQKRTQLTGSVVTLKAEALEASTAPSLDAMLGGQVSGLAVTQTSGQPGASSSIRIRGAGSVNAANDPLYVIDGFIYYKDASSTKTGIGAIESSLNPLASVNPSDIESIEVLKDISATAIYGSRGANGVILVNTKKGERGKTHVNYRFTSGWSSPSKKLDMMNATEWAAFQKTYFNNKGGYTDEEIAALGEGTDWQDAVLRTGWQQQHEVSVSGGDEKTRFLISGNYVNQDGIVINSDFSRYNLRINLERIIVPGLTVGITSTFGQTRQNAMSTTEDQDYNSSPYQGGITNSLTYALLMPPVVSIYNADGSYNYTNPYEYSYFAIGSCAANPVSDLENTVAESINDYLIANAFVQYAFSDFTAKVTMGTNRDNITQNFFAPSYTALGLAQGGIGAIGTKHNEVWQWEATLDWSKYIGSAHFLNALAGYTYQKTKSNYLTATAADFTNEDLAQYNLADGADLYSPETGSSSSALHSLIARVNYVLLDKYNLTATLRADKSSRFAADHRWGVFPSLGLSWNIDREPFLQGFRHLYGLKLRLSGGTVGNQEIGDYEYAQTYTAGTYNGSTTYSKSNTGNSGLKWETTASFNVGIDADFYGGRLGFVFDAYYKKTSDLLLSVPVSATESVTTQLKNVGNVVNKGLEFSVRADLIDRKNLSWSVSANIATNHNEVTSIGSNSYIYQGDNGEMILLAGEALGSFYGLVFDGIVQSGEDVSQLPTMAGSTLSAGQIKFKDLNGDGNIDKNDRTVIGSIQPDFTYGLSTTLTWRDWDLYLAFQGSCGNEVYNALRRTLEHATDEYNVSAALLNSWTEENASNLYPIPTYSRPTTYIDSRYVEDASYLRLKNLTLGYTPRLHKFPVKVRLFFTATNLLTLTGYKGYDPEVASGIDQGAYPNSRTFSIGANLSF